jgi:hypothetical protein
VRGRAELLLSQVTRRARPRPRSSALQRPRNGFSLPRLGGWARPELNLPVRENEQDFGVAHGVRGSGAGGLEVSSDPAGCWARASARELRSQRSWYSNSVHFDDERAGRNARAAARRERMTIEVVALGERKPSPYADSSADERLAAAVRLIEHHQALRGGGSALPRSAWPGETFVSSEKLG